MKVKCDHRCKFSNLSNWKEEALITNRPRSIYQYYSMAPRLSGQNCKFFKFLLSQFQKESWIQRKQHQI